MDEGTVLAGRIGRLRELMGQRGYDAVVLRNNPDLRWLTGAERVFDDEVAHTAFITLDGLWLHTDSRYDNSFLERMGKDGPWLLDMEVKGAPAWVADRISQVQAHTVAIEDTVTVSFLDELSQACVDLGLECSLPRLHGDIMGLRMIKDKRELELIQHAQDITDAAFEHICGYIKAGMTEQQVRVELENYMFNKGADALSFETIIAAGPNGANPHARPSDYVIKDGDMIVMDYGAGYRDYHSDMTRTVCVGEPSSEQRKVYDVVRLAHETCAEAAKPGVLGTDMQALAVKVIADAGFGDYFGHGLGHGVGLEIHELPSFGRRYPKPVPEGSVITIEPGIYLPGKFGVRLEDFGLISSDGFLPFTHSPHELQIVG